jgi:hypothetical protein
MKMEKTYTFTKEELYQKCNLALMLATIKVVMLSAQKDINPTDSEKGREEAKKAICEVFEIFAGESFE